MADSPPAAGHSKGRKGIPGLGKTSVCAERGFGVWDIVPPRDPIQDKFLKEKWLKEECGFIPKRGLGARLFVEMGRKCVGLGRCQGPRGSLLGFLGFLSAPVCSFLFGLSLAFGFAFFIWVYTLPFLVSLCMVGPSFRYRVLML